MSEVIAEVKAKGLEWLKRQCYAFAADYKHACILDSCKMDLEGDYEFIAAFGATAIIDDYKHISTLDMENQWWFGVLSYEVKNRIEALKSLNENVLESPEFLFFSPEIMIAVAKTTAPDGIGELIVNGEIPSRFYQNTISNSKVDARPNSAFVAKENYLQKINQIHNLIREGEVYELNFCVNHEFKFTRFEPEAFQWELVNKSSVPMASFFKSDAHVLCGASMERFLRKKGRKLFSQPIKGTISRGANPQEDEANRTQLANSEKDKAENVMIVDLVRNDMNKVCKTGSVRADALFEIHPFPKVHQMISTVSGELKADVAFEEMVQALFPMGSMTGAPKIAAMKYIDELEQFARNWYSGCVGYITPQKDFDFNVVIRSLIANTEKGVLSYSAGGAITIDSDPELEWEEMKLKTKSIESILNDRP